MPTQGPRPLLLGMVLCLIGCFQEDNSPEYDIRIGDVLYDLNANLDPDGEPVLLVKVGMIFGLNGEPTDYYPPTQLRNFPSIVYSRKQGSWSRFHLRDLNRYNEASGAMLRDGAGNLRFMLSDYEKIRLYKPEGDAWKLSSRGSWPFPRMYGQFGPVSMGLSGGDTLQGLDYGGDSTLRIVSVPEPGHSLTLPFLKTYSFLPYAFHSGPGFNAMAGYRSFSPDSGEIVYASWAKDFKTPARSTVIWQGKTQPKDVIFQTLQGSQTVSVLDSNSFTRFFLDSEGMPGAPFTVAFLPLKELGYNHLSFTMDEAGCLHELASETIADRHWTFILHRSSCEQYAIDTLRIPPSMGPLTSLRRMIPMAAKGGGIHVAFSMEKDILGVPRYDEYTPGWLYLATYRDKAWTYEQVASF